MEDGSSIVDRRQHQGAEESVEWAAGENNGEGARTR